MVNKEARKKQNLHNKRSVIKTHWILGEHYRNNSVEPITNDQSYNQPTKHEMIQDVSWKLHQF